MIKNGILNKVMVKIQFAKAIAPPKVAMQKWWWLPLAIAAVNAAMATAQLVSFDTFTGIVESYGLLQGPFALVAALLITALEILSLPVLLRLRLSPLMRVVSAAAVFLVPLVWLQLLAWSFLNGFMLINAGFFGKFLSQPFGWWLLVEMVVYVTVSLFALKVVGGDTLLSKAE